MLELLAGILLIGVLVTVHEFGHFVVAKLAGVKVEVFSIGFGAPILKAQWGETEYRIAWLPIGGYVRMLGMDPADVAEPQDLGRSLYDKRPLTRILIYAAGPAMNIALPLLIVAPFVWLASDYDEVVDNRIGALDYSMPAYEAGLREGDVIVEMDGAPIDAFWQISERIDGYDPDDGPIAVTVERPGEGRVSVEVTPREEQYTNPLLGFTSTDYKIGYMPAALASDVALTDPIGAAARAGVQTFDRVLRVGEAGTPRYVDVVAALKTLAPGASTTLLVERDLPLEPGADGASLTARFPFLKRTERIELTYTASGAPGLGPASTCVRTVQPDHPAAAVLQRGDCLLSVDGQRQSLGAFLMRRLTTEPERPKAVVLLRDGVERTAQLEQVKVTIEDPLAGSYDQWQLGFTIPFERGLVPAGEVPNENRVAHGWYEARSKLADEFELTLRTIGGLFTAKVDATQLSGPLTIFYLAGEQAKRGLEHYLDLMVLLSLSIGLFNLLPVPLLDGGHILVAGVEMITRRPPSEKTRMRLQYVGLALILALFLFATFNDLIRMLRVSSG